VTRLAQQERLGVHAQLGLGFQLGQHGGLGGFEHAVEAAQHGEGQDDLAVVGLLVVATEEVGDGPDEGGQGLLVHEETGVIEYASRSGLNISVCCGRCTCHLLGPGDLASPDDWQAFEEHWQRSDRL
jgi:hypothetical protein